MWFEKGDCWGHRLSSVRPSKSRFSLSSNFQDNGISLRSTLFHGLESRSQKKRALEMVFIGHDWWSFFYDRWWMMHFWFRWDVTCSPQWERAERGWRRQWGRTGHRSAEHVYFCIPVFFLSVFLYFCIQCSLQFLCISIFVSTGGKSFDQLKLIKHMNFVLLSGKTRGKLNCIMFKGALVLGLAY